MMKNSIKSYDFIWKILCLIAIIAIFVILNSIINNKRDQSTVLIEDSSRYAYQVDCVIDDGNKVKLSGWFFYLESVQNELTGFNNNSEIKVALLDVSDINNNQNVLVVSATAKKIYRKDVNDYFACEFDYSNTGFEVEINKSSIDLTDRIYQIILFPNKDIQTGIKLNAFLINGQIVYTDPRKQMELEIAGTDLETVVSLGKCLYSSSAFHISIYQYEWKLYWIVDEKYDFDDNGTFMQYQTTTTQFSKLPESRVKNHWFWGNLGDSFEKYEISDEINSGKYRVCVRDIPNGYAVNSIEVGYTNSNGWVWRSLIRPYYGFDLVPKVSEYGYVG